MLVLSRKLNERILIGDNISIKVVSIRGNQVRIGIEAPDSVRVFREELCTGRSSPAGSPSDAELPVGSGLGTPDSAVKPVAV